MMRIFRLLRAYWANSLALDLEYRIDFVISGVTSLLSCGAGLIALSVIFTHASSLGGWTFHQALALYGIYLFLEEYAQGFLANNIGQLPELIRKGDLDFTLLKPVNSQLQTSVRHFRITEIPSYLLALGVIFYAMAKMETITPLNLALLSVFLISAMVLIYSIWSLLHTLAFWFVKVDNISQFFYAIFYTAPFPATAFPPKLRFVLTFVIPVAFMTTVPASAASGAVDWRYGVASPLVAAFSLWVAHLFWQRALRHYSSASS